MVLYDTMQKCSHRIESDSDSDPLQPSRSGTRPLKERHELNTFVLVFLVDR